MKILMVCLGNICRSPLAQGILEKKIAQHNMDWVVDSAGTSGWHDGEPPDDRSIKVAREHGIDISQQISRKILKKDLSYFDLILTMDSSNYQDVMRLYNDAGQAEKVHLIMNFVFPDRNMAVPDPYYDGRFDEVYDILDKSLDKFLDAVAPKLVL